MGLNTSAFVLFKFTEIISFYINRLH